jgi:4-diphosphocytidyl-2-C-methyl-D-erythritol kinase
MLQEEHSLPGMDIHLHKVVPFGAGLGGGSADAAFFLRSVNEHLGLKIPSEKLKTLAGRLGADCAFFLENSPAYATGIGEKLLPVDLSLKGYHLLLVKPQFGIETKEAYSGVIPAEYPLNFKEIIKGEVKGWSDKIKNDFETTLFAKYPELASIKNRLTRMGAAYASMSGSGSSIYAIFERKPEVNEGDFPVGYFLWQEELS